MKLRIDKLQSGGSMPFLPYTPMHYQRQGQSPAPASAGAPSPGGESAPAQSELLNKQMLNEVLKESLTNEAEVFLNTLQKYENSGPFNSSLNRNMVYKLGAMANSNLNNARMAKDAMVQAEKNGGLDEYATKDGHLFTLTQSGKVEKISITKFDPSKQQALTNNELDYYRRISKQLVNNSEIFGVIRNSIGKEKINDYIWNIVGKIGNSESSSEVYQSISQIVGDSAKKPSQDQLQALQGLSAMYEQFGSDALLKVSELTVDQQEQAKLALNYIYRSLPNNMRDTLKADFVVKGGDPEKIEENIQHLINSAIYTKVSDKQVRKLSYDSNVNPHIAKKIAKEEKEAAAKVHRLTPLEQFFDGNLNRGDVVISDPNYKNRYAMTLVGNTLPSLALDSGKGAGSSPLHIALDHEGQGMGKYLDYQQVYIGQTKVSQAALSSVAYAGQPIAQVFMPVNASGGIDWSLMGNYVQANDKIKELGIDAMENSPEKYQAMNKVYAEHSLGSIKFDTNGKVSKYSQVAPFFMTHGYMGEKLAGKNNSLYKELTGDDEDQTDDLVAEIFKKAGLSNPIGMMENVITAPIFIRVGNNAALNSSTYAGYGSQVNNPTLDQNMLTQESQRRTEQPIMADTDVYYQQQQQQ